jgi:RND family efflux transporter MFP subunit
VKAVQATRLRAQAQVQRTQSQYKRLARAGKEGTIGGEDVEEVRLGAEAARAGLEEVEAQITSAEAERDASRARLGKARADVLVAQEHLAVAGKNQELAATLLNYRKITAPFPGVVTRRNVEKGQFVQPATGVKGDVLFEVARTDVMRVRVEVPEADADWISKDTPIRIRVPALKTYQFEGKVTRTSWALDRTSRTLLAETDVPDPEGRLRPGMYAYATLTPERPGLLAVPASAVVTEGDVTLGYHTFCFLVQDGKARRTPVEVWARDKEWVEVLRKQVGQGAAVRWETFTGQEEVVQGNLSELHDGQPVLISAAGK